jgi:3-methyladenine DNA glycosylase AlkC
VEPFKNNFSPELVSCFADHLQKHISSFNRESFEKPICALLEQLELKDRAQLIADHLHAALPNDLHDRARVIRAMLRPEAGQVSDELGIGGWGVFPLSIAVGQHGLDDFGGSLELLKDMTHLFSSEFGVRYFLLADQERALQIMGSWVRDPSHHVRRLVSEGTRPRLPWAMQLPKLIDDPTPTLPILEALRDDKEEYVRRSVANHLNDIAKDHPDVVAGIAKSWLKGANRNREQLVRHACRSLIKQGHPRVLTTFGFGKVNVSLDALTVEPESIKLGEAVQFTATLRSIASRRQSLLIDYVMHFQKANGTLSGKVFKWKTLDLEAGEAVSISRSHTIRQVTTRRYYSGRQAIALRINGRDFGLAEFELVVPDFPAKASQLTT